MRLHWLLPKIVGIPVLMYHRVWPGMSDGLTITPEDLGQQWQYLKNEGYSTLSLPDFLAIANGEKPYPPKSVLLTFDDGYENNLTYVYPLLQQLGWAATLFVIGDTLDGTAKPETEEANKKLSVAQLQSIDPQVMQLALHGYHHADFNAVGIDGIIKEMESSIHAFEKTGLPFQKVLAYPYGARPKDSNTLTAMKQWLAANGIEAAFRIGNQVSKIPVPDIFEIRRIDIKGTDTFEDFKIKLSRGKLKPF